MRLGATLTRVRDRVVRGRRAARPAAQLRAAVPDASDPRRAVARAAAAVGVDIGSAWIKIVELVGGRDGFSVRARLTVPTPPGTVRGGRISFPPVVGRVLRDALSHAGIRTRRAVASVSGHVSLVREVRLPRLSGDELREAARFEVMRYLPYPITEATYDAFVLGEVPDTGAARMEVLLAAARTDLLAQHVDTLRAAGLEPAVIDVEPFALLRAMVPAGTPAGRPGLYLHLGATHTGILIVDGTTPRVARSVVGGGNVITQRIAAQRGLSLEEAETYKIRLSGQRRAGGRSPNDRGAAPGRGRGSHPRGPPVHRLLSGTVPGGDAGPRRAHGRRRDAARTAAAARHRTGHAGPDRRSVRTARGVGPAWGRRPRARPRRPARGGAGARSERG